MVCTFFGHRGCHGLDTKKLHDALEELIKNGAETFYVGNQGLFDSTVLTCLLELRETYPHISFSVVLAYLPTQRSKHGFYHGFSIFPEGFEAVPPRFAIEKRNKWMIDRSDYCLYYVNHTWGGAYKFASLAKRRGLTVINLGGAKL